MQLLTLLFAEDNTFKQLHTMKKIADRVNSKVILRFSYIPFSPSGLNKLGSMKLIERKPDK